MNSVQTKQVNESPNPSAHKVGDCLSKGTSGNYNIRVYLLTPSPSGPLDFHIYNKHNAEEYLIRVYPKEAFGENRCGQYSTPITESDYNKLNIKVSESTLPADLVERFQQGIQGATVPSAMDTEN